MTANGVVTLPRKERLILELLTSEGPMYGLQLVEHADGALKRGTAGSTSSSRVPGTTLLRIARLLFNDHLLSAVVEPTIADLQREIADAGPEPCWRRDSCPRDRLHR